MERNTVPSASVPPTVSALLRPTVLILALVLAARPAPSGEATEVVDAALAAAVEETGRAAKGLVRDDRALVLSSLDAASAALEDGPTEPRSLARAVDRFAAAVASARNTAADGTRDRVRVLRALRGASRKGRSAQRALRRACGPLPRVELAGGGLLRPGRRGLLRVTGVDGSFSVEVVEEGPGLCVDGPPESVGDDRLRFRGGEGPGTALLRVSWNGETRFLRWVNGGRRGDLGPGQPWGEAGEAPATLDYGLSPRRLRASTALHPLPATVTGGEPESFSVDPPLPAGLELDRRTGSIAGVPSTDSPMATYTITASNPHGSATFAMDIEVAPALPPGLLELEEGFSAEVLLDGLDVPVKMAAAPDGRLFFNELATGRVRVVGADGVLRGTPVASLPVQTGGENGLLGIAVDPDFAGNGRLYVFATTPAEGQQPVRNRVLRLTLAGDVSVATEVLVDDLPAAALHNGGDLQFGPDGMLYVSLGDADDPDSAQADGALSGRVLRFAPDGSVPGDNPVEGSPEWCRGLRNPFDMTFHPVDGGLFATENGPTAGDELEFLLPGRNFGWPELPEGFPGSLVGNRLREWTPVIVPTGLVFHPGTGFGDGFADNLFLGGYDAADVRRLVMSGARFTDVDAELPFARWDATDGVAHRPLDLLVAEDGSLLVSTFTALWRIRRYGVE